MTCFDRIADCHHHIIEVTMTQGEILFRNIDRLLIRKNMSTESLRYKTDISSVAMRRIMSDNANPTLSTIAKIADALEVSVPALLTKK